MPMTAARETPLFVTDPPLITSLKRGEIASALELLKISITQIDEPDSQGLRAIHWACFLRQNDVIKALLNNRCRLDQGPPPSTLYEYTVTNGALIFEHAKKGMIDDTLPFAGCILETLNNLSSLCTNLNWTNTNKVEESFWIGRDNISPDPLILLDLKKVATPSVRAIHSFFQTDRMQHSFSEPETRNTPKPE